MFEISRKNDRKLKIKEKIIVALDVSTAQEARNCIAELRDKVGAFKIGLQLFSAVGASFVREIIDEGIKLFLDLKFHDIPNTVANASVEAARLGVWMFNIHAIGGSEMIKRTVENVGEICEKENIRLPKIIGVTVLTSSDQTTLSEIGINSKVDEQVLRLARLSAENGLDGVVASANEIELIRQNIENKDFMIVTPGIRNFKMKKDNQIGTNDDQKRVMTPSEAISAGSDYLVIGRPILQAEDKYKAVREIVAEIENS